MTQKLPHILVVDDERAIRLTLETGLAVNGFRVTALRSGREALAAVQAQDFDGVVCDVFMPDGDGLQAVRALRVLDATLPIILITAQGSLELAVQAVNEGANDFLAKPFEMGALAALLHRHVKARREVESAPENEISADLSQSGLIGRSAGMLAAYKLIAHAARHEATVLITGESGTGKELAARAIHRFSARAKRSFVAVNCAGLTDTLLEAELFGHVRGAFTGAQSDRAGLFEAAEGGTLFLDELAATSPAFQVSLLRALQSGEVRRVGSTQTRRLNVRVIGASNAQLLPLVEAGQFRADLYYRLSVLSLDLPPLRERAGDIELLAQHFLRRLSGDKTPPLRLSKDATAALQAHTFPGNVRELENALTRAAALAAQRLITLDCLPPQFAPLLSPQRPPRSEDWLADHPTMEEWQRRYVQFILQECDGNRRRAARILALDRRTISRFITRYQLEASSADEDSNGDDE